MGNKAQTIGFRYMLGVEACGCLAPVDAFVQLDIGNRVAWRGNVTASGQIDIDLPNLFGGDMSQGGVSGIVEVRMGEPSQVSSAYMESVIGNPIPANRGLFCLLFRGRTHPEILSSNLLTSGFTFGGVLGKTYPSYAGQGGFYWAAMNPYIKPIAPTVTRILAGWGIPVWYSAKATIVQNRDSSSAPIGTPTFTTFTRDASGAGQTTLDYDVTNTDLTPDFTGYAFVNTEWFKVTAVDSVNFILHVVPAQFSTTAAAHISGSQILLYEAAVRPIVAMNPAHMIYQCIFDPAFGLGKPTSLANDAVWRATADTLFAEGFGLCMVWADQATLEDFVNDVLKHIDAVLDFNLQTGFYELRLIRNDYDVSTLQVFDQTNILSMDNFSRSGWGETTNEVIVQFTDQSTGGPNTVPVQDLANILIQTEVVSRTQIYVGIQDPMLAIRVGSRDLQVLSTPLAAFTIKVNRLGWKAKRGDPVKVTWPANKLNQVVCRILDIDFGTLEGNTMTFALAEDVFALPASANVSQAPQMSLWQNPSASPATIQVKTVLEIPYQILQSIVDTSSLTGNESYPLVFAQKPAAQNAAFRVNQSDTTAFTVFEQLIEPVSYNPTVSLSAAALVLDTTFSFTSINGSSPDMFTGGVALIDNEWIGITSVNLGAGTMVVVRGVFDSVPAPHSSTALVWFFTTGSSFKGFMGTDSVSQMSKGTQEFYRVTGRSVSGETAISSATSVPHTHGATWNNPYPPANVKIDGVLFPTSISGDFTISWNGRNRLQQAIGLIGWTAASIAPEAGVSYTLQVFDATTSALIKQYDGLPCSSSGGSFHFTADLGSSTNLKVVLFAVRGICQSNPFVLTAALDLGGYGLSYDTSYGGATLGTVLAPGVNSLAATPVTEVPYPFWINGAWYSFANEGTLRSTDNVVWAVEGPASQGTFSPNPYNGAQEMVFGNGMFAFANGQGYSYKGVGGAWVSVASSALAGSLIANPTIDNISFDGTQFVLLASEGDDIWTSPDAQTWTHKGASPNTLSAMSTKKIFKVGLNYIAHGLVAGAMSVAHSTDLVSWTFAAADVRSPIAFFSANYYSLSSTGIQKSTDCLTWTAVTSPLPSNFALSRWSIDTSEIVAYGTSSGAAYSVILSGATFVKFEAAYDTVLLGEKANLSDTGTAPGALFVRVGSPQEYGGKLLMAGHGLVAGPIFPSTAPNGHYFGVTDEVTLGSIGSSAYDDSGLTNRDTANTMRSPRRVGTGTKHYLEFTVLAFDPSYPQSSTATFNAQLVSDFAAPSSLVQGRGTTDFSPQIGDIVGYALDLTTTPGTLTISVNGVTLKTVSGFGINQNYTFIIQPSAVADKHAELHLNVGQSAFAHAPGGYTAWND